MQATANESNEDNETGIDISGGVSPRKELTSSAISVRSKSLGPGKQVF